MEIYTIPSGLPVDLISATVVISRSFSFKHSAIWDRMLGLLTILYVKLNNFCCT